MKKKHLLLAAGGTFILAACTMITLQGKKNAMTEKSLNKISSDKAIFAGGCFWCMEPPFKKLQGVLSVTSGYTGGKEKKPTYESVSSGKTGHTEAIEITYDPNQITYKVLLKTFWKNIDPKSKNRQFCDSGTQYRSGIYYLNKAQKELAEKSRKSILNIHGTVHTEITAATLFWKAEDYHQDYANRNPVRYKYYRYSCGRDARLEELWKGKNIDF